jgi:hypothetical protein
MDEAEARKAKEREIIHGKGRWVRVRAEPSFRVVTLFAPAQGSLAAELVPTTVRATVAGCALPETRGTELEDLDREPPGRS